MSRRAKRWRVSDVVKALWRMVKALADKIVAEARRLKVPRRG